MIKTKYITPIIVILVLLLQMAFPAIVHAVSSDEFSLNVELKANEDNDTVEILATDAAYNIVELKYVHKYITLEEIKYFEQENSDVINIPITPSKEIHEKFSIDGYGSYTVYVKNARGDRFLSRITFKNAEDSPKITIQKDSENPLHFNLDVTSSNSNIVTIKIAKKENINDEVDFNKEGTKIEFVPSNHVSLKYTNITEVGLYQIYAEDENGNSSIYQIYLAHEATPIFANISDADENMVVTIDITDSICNIVKIKVAKKDEISDFNDFETKGEELSITPSQNIHTSYTVPEDGNYVFYIEDEAGYKKMVYKRVQTDENSVNIKITQDENNPKNITIHAFNSISNIIELKVATGDNIDFEYFQNNGEALEINPGKDITVQYTLEENAKLSVYMKDEDGHQYITTKTILGIDNEPSKNQAPIIQLEQNMQNLNQIDVTVSDIDSFIDTIKWTAGSKDTKYFQTNGIAIGTDILGKIVKTSFEIDKIGIYTVYAKDVDGNEIVKEINITTLEEEPEKDITAPIITGVLDGTIYNKDVTPSSYDENLKNVNLKKNDQAVNNYNNGDTIKEEGNYELIATDKSNNTTTVSFIIDKTAPTTNIQQSSINTEKVRVETTYNDNLTPIKVVKIAEGNKDTSYFTSSGQEIPVTKNENSATAGFNIIKNGIYTIYVEDEAGNSAVETFEVNSIVMPPEDTTPPEITINKKVIEDNKRVEANIEIIDIQSEISNVKYSKGNQAISYFDNNGEKISIIKEGNKANGTITLVENGSYTVFAKDSAGNKSIKSFNVSELTTEAPDPMPGEDTTPPKIIGVENGKTYTSSVTPIIEDENLDSITLEKDGEAIRDFSNGTTINENGNYILTAIDKYNNTTKVSFSVNISEPENPSGPDDENNTVGGGNTTGNDNTSNDNNTTTGDNTIGNNTITDNTINTNTTNELGNNNTNNETTNQVQNGSIEKNEANGNSNYDSNADSKISSQDKNLSKSSLPYTGLKNTLIIFIIIGIIAAFVSYSKYKNIK